jgi:uncharacterized membrane protein
MIDECVVAVYPSLDGARQAIDQLNTSGFPSAQISLVTIGLRENAAVLEQLKLCDDSMHEAAVTAGLGSFLGALGGLATMVLSGVGVVFLMGPVAGGIMGGVAGAYIGAISGWGVHEHQIRHYERLIQNGSVLIIANGDPIQLLQAFRLLEKTAPSEVHTYARTGDEQPESE